MKASIAIMENAMMSMLSRKRTSEESSEATNSSKDDDHLPSKERRASTRIADYLEERPKTRTTEMRIREAEIDVQHRCLDIDARQLHLEEVQATAAIEERKARHELALMERRAVMNAMTSSAEAMQRQTELLTAIVQKLKRNTKTTMVKNEL